MSMVGIELEKYINTELTWKTVVKGNRSGSRRPRKTDDITSKNGAKWGRNNFKIPREVSVSESEKNGVAVLGRRFGDKVVVPIKKRRTISRSTSRSPQSNAKDSLFMKARHFLDHEERQMEDFSGIEILAAAACMTSIGDNFDNIEEVQVDENLGQDRIDSSTSTTEIPLKNNNNMESLNLPQDSSHDYPLKKDEVSLKISVASCDDRSHWDLNTVMDAWEPICDEPIVNTQYNVLENNPCDDMHNNGNQKVDIAQECNKLEEIHAFPESREEDKHVIETRPTFIPNLIDNIMKEPSFSCADMERQDGFIISKETNKIYDDDYASRSGKNDLECIFDDISCDSNVSQDNNHGHVVDLENEINIQDGYNSQYEDGELREPNFYTERNRGQETKHSIVSSKMKISGWDQFPVSSSNAEKHDGKFVEARGNQRQLVSYDDVPSSSDGFDRKDTRLLHRATNMEDSSYLHSERDTEHDKFTRRVKFPWYDKSQGRDRWDDRSTHDWDSKSRHTLRYYAPYNSDHSEPQKGTYGTSRYAHGGFGRRSRTPNNGYNEPPMVDHYFTRREQRYFPPSSNNRGISHFSQPRKNFRSRSRSQERDVGPRHFRSRSPDFRFNNIRMNNRDRFPIQKPSIESDYDTDFIPPPRNRFPAKHNSRWIDDQEDHFRSRRSPVRMFRQFDHGRFESPMMQQRKRFDERRKYEGGDEYRKKFNDKFENRAGHHFDREGFSRRSRYDGENRFVSSSNSHDIQQPQPNRKVREEKGQMRSNNSDAKTFDEGAS